MSSDEYRPSDPQLVEALDHAWVFRQAHRTLKDLGMETEFPNVLALAEYMSPPVVVVQGRPNAEEDSGGEQADSSTEGAE